MMRRVVRGLACLPTMTVCWGMRYSLLIFWVCVSCVTTSSPPARAAQETCKLGALAVNANAQATLREDYLHTAFALYHAAAATPGNVVVAPHTTATALAMLYNGARGASAKQLASALHWRLAPEPLDAAHQALQSVLLQRAATDSNTIIQLASRLWLGTYTDVVDAYQDLTARYLGTDAGIVDFAGHPSDARATINAWVAEQTHDLIRDLLGPDAIGAHTALVQTSAMYFKANWQYPFDIAADPALFHNADGSSTAVTMLDSGLGAKYRYAQTPLYQAVEVYYEGAALAMDIIVPRATLADVASHWHAAALQELAQAFAGRDVLLHLPKFAFESTQDVTAALQALGVHDLFDPERADLTGMVRGARIAVGTALGKAKIAVDEHGTEAAAATAIVLAPASAEPGEAVEVTVDKPFLFVVRDVAQDVVLLMGRVEQL